jgi:hypothetical protein
MLQDMIAQNDVERVVFTRDLHNVRCEVRSGRRQISGDIPAHTHFMKDTGKYPFGGEMQDSMTAVEKICPMPQIEPQ